VSDEVQRPRPERRGFRKGVYIIPSLFTTANIFCGFYAVIESVKGSVALNLGDIGSASQHFDVAAISIGWAVLFDFLDGRVARMTNSTTQFGVEFDSIADVLTFGIAPAMLAYCWGYGFTPALGHFPAAVSFLYLICGALRLARFNVQASKPALQKPNTSPKLDKKAFVGMPIPAGASLIAAIVHFWPVPASQTVKTFQLFEQRFLIGPQEWSIALLVLVGSLGALMVSTIRYTSFKGVGPKSRNPRMVILLIAFAMAAIYYYSAYTLLAMATLYALHGVIGKLFGMFRRLGHPHAAPDVPHSSVDVS
jgi:CDP-diacylglycerol--serine O-phosphatidyltransferase